MPTMLESMMNVFKGSPGHGNQQAAPQNQNNQNGVQPRQTPAPGQNATNLTGMNLAQGTGTTAAPGSPNSQMENSQQGNDGNSQQQGNNNNQNASPLDMFSKMWENKSSENQNGNGNQGQSIFTPDMTKLDAAVKTMDFMKGVNPELVQKALSGDQAAFTQVLNSAIQGSFSQALLASSQIAERGMSTVRGQIEKGFDGRIKNFTASDRLQSSNKNFNHPAFKPLLSAVQAKISESFPEATPDEIVQYSQQYMEGISGLMTGNNGKGGNGNNQEQRPESQFPDDNSSNQNWGSFFN